MKRFKSLLPCYWKIIRDEGKIDTDANFLKDPVLNLTCQLTLSLLERVRFGFGEDIPGVYGATRWLNHYSKTKQNAVSLS